MGHHLSSLRSHGIPGCAFYVERNYYNTSDGVPYGAIRRAIQIMNPAKVF